MTLYFNLAWSAGPRSRPAAARSPILLGQVPKQILKDLVRVGMDVSMSL